MKATLRQHFEPLFGGKVEVEVEAEIVNARNLTNRTLMTEMAQTLRHLGEEVHAESERTLIEASSDGDEGTRLARVRERSEHGS